MGYRIGVFTDDYNGGDEYKVYGFYTNEDTFKGHYLTIENGTIAQHPKEEGEKAKEPLFAINRIWGRQFLQALAQGLANAGFVAEVDNKQRIAAEAKFEVKTEEANWLRDTIKTIIERMTDINL